MSLRVLEQKNINYEAWDKCILSSNTPLVFAQSWYLNATCEKWKALVYGDYETVMPLTFGTNQFIKYLIQPPFTPQLGLFGKINEKIIKEVSAFLREQFLYVNIETNFRCKLLPDSLTTEKQTFIIASGSKIKINENSKRNISKALKEGLVFEEIHDFKFIMRTCNRMVVPWLVREIGLSKLHGLYFRELLIKAYSSEQLSVFCVKDKTGEIKALGYFISNGVHTVYLKGMTTSKRDKTGSMHLLLHKAVLELLPNCKWFDFGGGSIAGLANFYKGLGGSPQVYYTYKVNKLPWPLNKVKK